jgi:integrase
MFSVTWIFRLSTIGHFDRLSGEPNMKIQPPNSGRPSKPTKRTGRARKGDGSLKLRGKIWWYIIPGATPGAKRIEKSCETSIYADAVQIKARALVEVRGVQARTPGIRGAKLTVGDVLDGYERYCEKQRPRSWGSMRTAIKHLRAAFGRIVADELTTADTDQFRDDRIADDSVTDSTVNRELGYLRAALRRETIVTPPRVTRIPYMRMPSEKDLVREGFIDREDYQKILAELTPSLQAIFVCAFHTGARSGELKMIQWRQVDFANSVIELRPKITKNSDGRWIPIWGDMREYLERQKAIRDRDFPECKWVFFWHHKYHHRAIPGEPLKDFRWAWSEACERAGFSDLLFHDLRRSAIKYADQEAGISPIRVRLMSGHKTDAVYSRYNIGGAKDIAKMGADLDESLKRKRR